MTLERFLDKLFDMRQSNPYGFTFRNWKAKLAGFPQEDSYARGSSAVKQKDIACVADGVTRDFIDGSVVTKNLGGLLKFWTGKYPKYAQRASQICVKNFMNTESLIEANKAIADYNSKTFENIDYLGNDFAGCTAAGIVEEEGILDYQFIADSGIAIFEKNGDLKFKTPCEGPNSEGSIDEEVRRKYNSGFNELKGRAIIRSKYRNNPEEPLAYGVLTGEKNAENYIRKGTEKINEKDFVLLYTDGVEEIIFKGNEPNGDFAKLLKENNYDSIENFCKERVATEGTLIVYQKFIPYSIGFFGKNYEHFLKDSFGPLHP